MPGSVHIIGSLTFGEYKLRDIVGITNVESGKNIRVLIREKPYLQSDLDSWRGRSKYSKPMKQKQGRSKYSVHR
ncbi:hypothetical protein ACQP3D_30620, partial [Escherichia coli]